MLTVFLFQFILRQCADFFGEVSHYMFIEPLIFLSDLSFCPLHLLNQTFGHAKFKV